MLYATAALAGSTAIAPGCCGHQDKPASQCAHASSEENIFGARLILHRTLGVGRAALGAGLIFLCSSRPL